MLPDVCQHTISVHMLEHTYLGFIIFAAPWMVDLLSESAHQNCKLRHNDRWQVWHGAASGQYWGRYDPSALGGDDLSI